MGRGGASFAPGGTATSPTRRDLPRWNVTLAGPAPARRHDRADGPRSVVMPVGLARGSGGGKRSATVDPLGGPTGGVGGGGAGLFMACSQVPWGSVGQDARTRRGSESQPRYTSLKTTEFPAGTTISARGSLLTSRPDCTTTRDGLAPGTSLSRRRKSSSCLVSAGWSGVAGLPVSSVVLVLCPPCPPRWWGWGLSGRALGAPATRRRRGVGEARGPTTTPASPSQAAWLLRRGSHQKRGRRWGSGRCHCFASTRAASSSSRLTFAWRAAWRVIPSAVPICSQVAPSSRAAST